MEKAVLHFSLLWGLGAT